MEPIGNEHVPTSIAIRQLVPDEWRDYQNLRHEMLRTDPAAFPPQAFADLEAPEEKWRANIESGIILVAYDGNQPAGMVRGTYDGNRAIARNMYTRLMHRGFGVGRQLMAELLARFEQEGRAELVELEVEDTQATARNMYERFGFSEVGRVPEGQKFMITMQKRLQKDS